MVVVFGYSPTRDHLPGLPGPHQPPSPREYRALPGDIHIVQVSQAVRHVSFVQYLLSRCFKISLFLQSHLGSSLYFSSLHSAGTSLAAPWRRRRKSTTRWSKRRMRLVSARPMVRDNGCILSTCFIEFTLLSVCTHILIESQSLHK